MASQELFLELGAEEIPASFVARAVAQLPALVTTLLDRERLEHGPATAAGTPRRLAVVVREVADRQPDVAEDVTGPPASAAFDKEGKPTRAALGFAQKHGVDPSALRVIETAKGAYVAVHEEREGRRAIEILPAICAELWGGGKLSFPKTMRWCTNDGPFPRPVHWLVALFGGEVVRFDALGVSSGAETRGHRFLSPGPIAVRGWDDHVAKLRAAHVLLDRAERREALERELLRAAREAAGALKPDPALVDEVLDLVEEPHAIVGSFDPAHLELPEAVIVQAMRGHQRYFALGEPGGRLLPRFVSVANTAQVVENVRRGNERVLRARLSDARFFFDEDRKRPLASRSAQLSGIVFQARLGTIADKLERVVALADSLAHSIGKGELCSDVRRAALLSKCDLVTLMVGEFPELQGVMGRAYATGDGEPEPVATAIEEHYLPRGAGDRLPSTDVGAIVGLADRIDTLVGCFAAGLQPTGAADPYGLRRACLGVIRLVLDRGWRLELADVVRHSHGLFRVPLELGPDEAVAGLQEFFRGRLRSLFGEEGHRGDVVEACLAAGADDLCDLRSRAVALEAYRDRPEFASLMVAFKRAHNIAKDTPPGAVDEKLLVEPEEKALGQALRSALPVFRQHVEAGRYHEAFGVVVDRVREPIDRFFEKVFVMVDDAALRENRLRMLREVSDATSRVAHLHLLQETT
ncbi:MAG: glycine--tRNA ligase subunit beta [Deltaproteobacteria bacterium]|nr:glycine--tRNA ligase subunit beta [Deltaproteobacteria bacterium]